MSREEEEGCGQGIIGTRNNINKGRGGGGESKFRGDSTLTGSGGTPQALTGRARLQKVWTDRGRQTCGKVSNRTPPQLLNR